MKTRPRTARRPISLFDHPPAGPEPLDIRARIERFAHAAGRRHRRTSAGTADFVAALRGYHGTLAVTAGVPIPQLDEALTAFATAQYALVRFNRRVAAVLPPAPGPDRTSGMPARSQSPPDAP